MSCDTQKGIGGTGERGKQAHVLFPREGDEVRSPFRDGGWTGGIEGIVGEGIEGLLHVVEMAVVGELGDDG